MKSVNNKITVSVNSSQKDNILIGGVEFKTALQYDVNYREKSPTIAIVIEGNEVVKNGDILLCHHNLFYLPSPYHLYDDLFSIPFSNVLFAKIKNDGEIEPICGNMICDRVEIKSDMALLSEQPKTHIDRAIVKKTGNSPYKEGQLLFHRPHAGYDIVYVWNGEEKRITKVHESQIVGVAVEAKN